MVSESGAGEARLIRRFSRSERALHWLLAVTFFIMLATGLALYLPTFARLLNRPVAKEWHIDAALALAAGTLVLLALHWPRFRRTFHELDRFDEDDREWLLGAPRRAVSKQPAPAQGRFNAGQKLNASVVAGLMVIEFGTGFLLWYGERDTRYRFAGTVIVHDWTTWILTVLVIGHLYFALVNPRTRHSLRGITLGSVDRDWAREHHAKWVAQEETAGLRDAAPRRDGPTNTE